MKVLMLDICFKLPDNWNGDLNDALKELIKYREENNCSPMCTDVEGLKAELFNLERTHDEYRTWMWRGFLDTLRKGKKVFGNIFFGEVDSEDYKKNQ